MLPKTVKERFEMRFHINEDKCWIWNAYKLPNGYGRFYLNNERRRISAHRMAWEIYRGEIPNGMCVLHTCDNRDCVNPEHLFLGTYQDNASDMVSKKRQAHPRGQLCGTSKLKEYQVIAILQSNLLHRELADIYGISRRTISAIKKGDRWTHLQPAQAGG